LTIEMCLSAEKNADNLFREIKDEFEKKGILAQAELLDSNVRVYSEYENGIMVKNAVAEAAGRFIIEQFEAQEIAKIVRSGYSFFTHEERHDLIRTIRSILEGSSEDIAGSLFLIRRKSIITKRLLEYFESKDRLYVDGFVPFRLKDYLSELEDFVDRSADDFLMQKEYNEFLGLLKYFVSMQEPKLAKVNVVACDDGRYLLLDERGDELSDKELAEIEKDIKQGQMSPEDLLISSLITLAPSAITVHNSTVGRAELLDTLKHIFSGRTSFCGGCDLCTMGNKGGKYLH